MLHVLVGSNDADSDTIHKKAQSKSRIIREWVVPKSANINDECILFTYKDGFLATALIASSPVESEYRGRPAYRADLSNLALLSPALTLKRVAKRLPEWGWIRQRSKSRNTPSPEIAEKLKQLTRMPKTEKIQSPQSVPTNLEALEGITYENKVLSRRRNAVLRSAALATANGICAACGRSFSTVLSGLGLHVLQVHHRKQLSLSTVPRVTSLKQLAVVCANCHSIIHADRKQALSVEKLRSLFKRSADH